MTSAPATPWWQRLAPLLGLFLLFVVLSLASPYFLTRDNLLNVLRQSTINAILALGQLAVIITAGIDLSIGSVVGLTIVVLTLLMRHGTPPLFAALVTVAVGTLIGLGNGAFDLACPGFIFRRALRVQRFAHLRRLQHVPVVRGRRARGILLQGLAARAETAAARAALSHLLARVMGWRFDARILRP